MTRDYEVAGFGGDVELHIDYAAELNAQQCAAVTAPPGPALVIAGAGSGKTRTLTYRVAFLLEQGVQPERILLLTFTNKAAQEMMRRVRDLVGRELGGLCGGTFHSVGARILRSHGDLLGYQRNFSILDREDSVALIKTCLEEVGPLGTEKPPPADQIAEHFSRARNRGSEVGEEDLGDLVHRTSDQAHWLRRLFEAYVRKKLEAQVMDFDDLLVLWLRLLTEHEAVRDHLQRRFQFILVDEYQDTNMLQGEIVDILAAHHHNLMVVGDDAQSIYSWRGANFRNILDFPKRHAGAMVFRIEENYRSTPEILAVANAVIANNEEQYPKELRAVCDPGEKPGVVACQDTQEQAAFIATRIRDLKNEGIPLNEIAVLYRAHYHTLDLQLWLQQAGIPFSITSGLRFFEQAHIKDITAYLRWIDNPRDEVAFKRLVRLMPGVGEKGAQKIWDNVGQRLRERLENPSPELAGSEPVGAGARLAEAMAKSSAVVPRRAAAQWAALAATLASILLPSSKIAPGGLIRDLVQDVYREHVVENYENGLNRLEEIEGLASFADEFQGLNEFLTQVALLTNVEAETESAEARNESRVRLSTIHQAKGLEFRVVFVIMLGNEMFPSAKSMGSTAAMEEERRLFYVAVTRARSQLYLTHPLVRVVRGVGMMRLERSIFLDEIPEHLVEMWNLRPHRSW